MKNFKLNSFLKLFILVFSSVIVLSCTDEDTEKEGVNPPIVNSVSLASDPYLEPISQGYANNMYVIQGSGFSSVLKIYFNDVDTYFNPTLVTNSSIFVTIDVNTPYQDSSNKLIIITKNGKVEYDFVVAPPAPVFKSFQPINAADGEIITIKGNYFLDPIVTVGGVAATLVSYTLTDIQVVLPTGSQGKRITVETISGSVVYSASVGTAIYDDIFYDNGTAVSTAGSWGSVVNIANTTANEFTQGINAIKVKIDPWSGFQIDNGPVVYPGATGIRFRMKAKLLSEDTGNTEEVKLIFNGGWGSQFGIELDTTWNEYTVTWEQLGLTVEPASFQQLIFFSTPTSGQEFYIDDIGYTLD